MNSFLDSLTSMGFLSALFDEFFLFLTSEYGVDVFFRSHFCFPREVFINAEVPIWNPVKTLLFLSKLFRYSISSFLVIPPLISISILSFSNLESDLTRPARSRPSRRCSISTPVTIRVNSPSYTVCSG